MRIHLIACGGAVMHNMAIALHKKGHQISGSDDVIYDPARSRLAQYGLLPDKEGWHADNITEDLDVIILGMHAKKGNPELEKAEKLGLTIFSFPQYLFEASKDKKRVVVAGSHGKTTITSMLMHALRYHNMAFDYMVGSSVEGFEDSVQLGDAPIMLLEGDEYLTSALDPRPKFLWYKPDVLLISGIAWDHINVFPDIASYHAAFQQLVEQQQHGALVYYAQDAVLDHMVSEQFKPDVFIKPYNTPEYKIENGQTIVVHENLETPLQLIGEHNLQNLEGARLVCEELGMSAQPFYEAMASFSGAGMRLELWRSLPNGIVFRDFAHAPSKVKASTDAVSTQYPEWKTVAVLELYTYSSLNPDFLPQYANALNAADVAMVYVDPETIKRKGNLSFTEKSIRDYFQRDDVLFFQNPQPLFAQLQKLGLQQTALLLMSSGNLGGIDFDAWLDSAEGTAKTESK